jgi:hypothetical protein
MERVTNIFDEREKLVAHEGYVGDRRIRLLGPYAQGNALCVGMDRLSQGAEEMFAFIRRHLSECPNVVIEGSRTHNFKRASELLNSGVRIHLVLLTTPIDVVLESLTARRAAKGQPPLADTQHILLNDRRAKSFARNLYQLGATVHQVDRESAPAKIVDIVQNSTLLFDKSAL